MSAKHLCQELRPWLKANLGKQCLAPLTTQDDLALDAAICLLKLFNYCDSRHANEVLKAFAAAVMTMLPHNRRLAYHAIAHVMDWHNRDQIWSRCGLPEVENPGVCQHEPGGGR
jgi:hypothetical protein